MVNQQNQILSKSQNALGLGNELEIRHGDSKHQTSFKSLLMNMEEKAVVGGRFKIDELRCFKMEIQSSMFMR